MFWRVVSAFRETAACVVKHTNPCGVALARMPVAAYRGAFNADSQSAFGGVVGLNRPCDAATAREISTHFTEVLVAPGIAPAARRLLAKRPNLRVVVPAVRVGAGLAPAPSLAASPSSR